MRRENFLIFYCYFSRISSPFFFPDFPSLFSLYFSIFFPHKTLIFFIKMWGIYRERWKWEASISVSGYASASLLSKGRLALVYHDTPMLASHFCHVISHFLSSSNFWLDLCTAAWRPFRAMFSSIFICTEISRCLVSNSLGFVQFGVTIVEISRLKGR